MTPALVTTAIFTFIWTYEDFLLPSSTSRT
jgi:ABC-type glycerol-3-phosphate transport system permease component